MIKDAERDKKSWYLLKVEDKCASKVDVTKKNKSVLSGLTVEGMAEDSEAKKWQSNRTSKEEVAENNFRFRSADFTTRH